MFIKFHFLHLAGHFKSFSLAQTIIWQNELLKKPLIRRYKSRDGDILGLSALLCPISSLSDWTWGRTGNAWSECTIVHWRLCSLGTLLLWSSSFQRPFLNPRILWISLILLDLRALWLKVEAPLLNATALNCTCPYYLVLYGWSTGPTPTPALLSGDKQVK